MENVKLRFMNVTREVVLVSGLGFTPLEIRPLRSTGARIDFMMLTKEKRTVEHSPAEGFKIIFVCGTEYRVSRHFTHPFRHQDILQEN